MGNACGTDNAASKSPEFYFHTPLQQLCDYESSQQGFAAAGYIDNVPTLVQDSLGFLKPTKGAPQPENWVESFEATINEHVKVVGKPDKQLLGLLKKENLHAPGVAVLLHHFFEALPEPLIPLNCNDIFHDLMSKTPPMQRIGTDTIMRRLMDAHVARHATISYVLKQFKALKEVFSPQEMTYICSSWFREGKGSPFGYAAVFLVDIIPDDEEEEPVHQQREVASQLQIPSTPNDADEEEPPILSEAEKMAKYGSAGIVMPGANPVPKPAPKPSPEDEEEPPILSEAEKMAKYGSAGLAVAGAVQPAAKAAPNQSMTPPADESDEEEPPILSEAEKMAKYGSAGIVMPGAKPAPKPAPKQSMTPPDEDDEEEPPILSEAEKMAKYGSAGLAVSGAVQPAAKAAPNQSMTPPADESDEEEPPILSEAEKIAKYGSSGLAAAGHSPRGVKPHLTMVSPGGEEESPVPSDAEKPSVANQSGAVEAAPTTSAVQPTQQTPQPEILSVQPVKTTSSHQNDSKQTDHDEAHATTSDPSGYQTDVSHGGYATSGWESGANDQQRPAAIPAAALGHASSAAQQKDNEQSTADGTHVDPVPGPSSGKQLLSAKLAFANAVMEDQQPQQQQGGGPTPNPAEIPIARRGDVELCMSLVQHLHRDSVAMRKEVGSFVSETATLVDELRAEVRHVRAQNERLEELVESVTISKQFRVKMQEAMQETTQNIIELNEDVIALRAKQKECDTDVQAVRDDNDRLATDVITARAASSEITMKWCDVERQLLNHEQTLSQQQRQLTGVLRDVQSVAANAKQTQMEAETLQRRFDVHRDAMLLS